jgi:hypothetical protein
VSCDPLPFSSKGPASFTPLIPTILAEGTKPPIAVYTHFIDTARQIYKPADNEPDFGPARFATYYPLCDYSPELVALRVGNETGARLRFIDLDYPDQILAQHTNKEQLGRPRIESLMRETYLLQSAYLHAVAQKSGCRDFNEMWDHLFEAKLSIAVQRIFCSRNCHLLFLCAQRRERRDTWRTGQHGAGRSNGDGNSRRIVASVNPIDRFSLSPAAFTPLPCLSSLRQKQNVHHRRARRKVRCKQRSFATASNNSKR